MYTLIATEQLFVDVSAAPLAEPERVPVFRDAGTARAWTVMLASASKAAQDVPHTVLLQAGAPVVWDGRPWTILNPGETTIALLAEDSTLIDLPITRFHALIATGKLVGLSTAPDRGKFGQMVRERLLRARKQDVEETNRRYHVITPILEGEQATENTSAGRTQLR